MSDYSGITALTLGNTFGGWYAKTNEMISRLNTLNVGSITGGDGIIVSKHPSIAGGYTLNISNIISKNVTFDGNVTINGLLNYSFGNEVSGLNILLPYESGVTIGNIVYVNSNGKVEKALADDVCTSEVAGIVVGFTGSSAQIATVGKISGSNLVETFLNSSGATLEKGVVYFLSYGISGSGTTAEPNTLNYISKPVLLGLTGDSGLILPFRGYKGSVTSGVCGTNPITISGISSGVLSFNGITGFLYEVADDDEGSEVLVTTGHVIGVNTIGVAQFTNSPQASQATYFKNVAIDTKAPINSEFTFLGGGYREEYRNLQNSDFSSRLNGKSSRQVGGNNVTLISEIAKSGMKQFTLYSTSGFTGDVWKLKNIKVHVQDPPFSTFSFSLIRTINRFGCTNFLTEANVGFDYIPVHPNTFSLRFGLSEISATNNSFGNHTIVGEADNITGLTILNPRIRTPTVTTFNGTVFSGLGITGGEPAQGNISTRWSSKFDSSAPMPDRKIIRTRRIQGPYPIIYGRDSMGSLTNSKLTASSFHTVGNRNYTWDFVPNIVGNTTDQKLVSEILFSSVRGCTLDFNGATSGVTMDTSILGWNRFFGAVSESLSIQIYDTELTVDTLSGLDHNKTFTVFLEMSKYDVNTQSDLNQTVIIPVNIQRDTIETSWYGQDVNLSNQYRKP